jgi:hypothetical protein
MEDTAMKRLSLVFLTGMIGLGAIASGCGGADESTGVRESAYGYPAAPAATAVASDRPQAAAVFPTPTPFPSAVEKIVEKPVQKAAAGPAGAAGPSDKVNGSPTALDRQVAAEAAQERVIVRNVSMQLEVRDVQASVNAASRLAVALGGWVVSSSLPTRYRGEIAVRVPAGMLDQALTQLRAMAAKVESETTTSQDFTEEFTDQTARVTTLKATQDTLRTLFNKAEKVEDAVRVQQELTKIQDEIERIQGRLNFIQQSAAFSLITAVLRSVPLEMAVDAGPDKTASTTSFAQFRVTFTPPEAIEDFTIKWDFGDGSEPVIVTRTAPRPEGGRISAPVTHFYKDEKESPYIVTVEVTGTGDAGIAEGNDTLVVTVTRIPAIEVFAGQETSAQAGEEVRFEGSFTRPGEVTDMKFTWDFGDGSAPATGDLAPGVTSAVATHAYANHRPQPYQATLTLEGQTPAGPAEAMSALFVFVREKEKWAVGGVDPTDTGRDAVRALSSIGYGLLVAVIWIGILSPFWLIVGGLGWFLLRRGRRAQAIRRQAALAASGAQPPKPPGP